MDTLFWIFVWLVCGLWAGSINNGKGHSYAAGFVLGMLLGPIGVIFAALSGKVNYDTARCPMCKENVRPDALICKHCGYKVPVDIDEEEAV